MGRSQRPLREPRHMTIDSTDIGTIDEHARRRFEQSWHEGRPQPIENFLSDVDQANYLATLEELNHIELELAWKAVARSGNEADATALRPASVESYLVRFPRLNDPAIVSRLA